MELAGARAAADKAVAQAREVEERMLRADTAHTPLLERLLRADGREL